MGSTISIHNDTEYTWVCRVGPDEKALKITGIVATAILAIGATVVTGGAVAAVGSAPMAYSASGLSAGIMASSYFSVYTAGLGVLATGGSTKAITAIGQKINQNLIEKGYHEVLSGATYETGKLSLSLWQQATCASNEILEPTVMKGRTLYMRPIFSGATRGSTNTYSIKEYLDGKGEVVEKIFKLESGPPNSTNNAAAST
jgi:hypothetical protein